MAKRRRKQRKKKVPEPVDPKKEKRIQEGIERAIGELEPVIDEFSPNSSKAKRLVAVVGTLMAILLAGCSAYVFQEHHELFETRGRF